MPLLDYLNVTIPEIPGIRMPNMTKYTTDHMDAVGKKWQMESANRLYVTLPTDTILTSEGYTLPGDELTEITGITNQTIAKLPTPYQIMAPINLGGDHWVGVAININADKSVEINYMDSMNSKINLEDHSKSAQKEISRIRDIFSKEYKHIKTQVFSDAQTQDDGVSCGPFALENMMRSLDKERPKPKNKMQIRAQQLSAFTSSSLLTSVSTSITIAEALGEYAKYNKGELNLKSFRGLLNSSSIYKESVFFEFGLREEMLESTKQSHIDTIQSAIKKLNALLINERKKSKAVSSTLSHLINQPDNEKKSRASTTDVLEKISNERKKSKAVPSTLSNLINQPDNKKKPRASTTDALEKISDAIIDSPSSKLSQFLLEVIRALIKPLKTIYGLFVPKKSIVNIVEILIEPETKTRTMIETQEDALRNKLIERMQEVIAPQGDLDMLVKEKKALDSSGMGRLGRHTKVIQKAKIEKRSTHYSLKSR